MSEFVFQLLKRLLGLWTPNELSSLENIGHRSYQGAKVADKSPIKGGKSMKTPYIMHRGGNQP